MFESHITVQNIPKEDFIVICEKYKLKPILIENDSGSGFTQQMMTSKFHKTANMAEALNEMFSLSVQFKNVQRRKLELILGKHTSIINSLYLEFHSKFLVPEEKLVEFEEQVKRFGHYSQNKLRPNQAFATCRGEDIFENMVAYLKRDFKY